MFSYVPDYKNYAQILGLRRRKLINNYVTEKDLRYQNAVMGKIASKVLVPTFDREYLTRTGIQKMVSLVEKLMFNNLPGSAFGTYFLEQEAVRIAELLLEADSCGTPLLIVAPVCPDYLKGGYKLGTETGDYAKGLIKKIPETQKYFVENGFSVEIELDVADGDAEDSLLEPYLNISQNEFLRRTKLTAEAIKEEIEKNNIPGVRVGSLLARAKEMRINYRQRQRELAELILSLTMRRSEKALNTLVKIREEEFGNLGIPRLQYTKAAAYELAGYAIYGELVGPDGLILMTSPMTLTGVVALNFLKERVDDFSPTLYLRNSKEKPARLFMED